MSVNQSVEITKMSGAGNTFLIINGRTDAFDSRVIKTEEKRRLAKQHCRETLAGADGFIFVEHAETDEVDFQWDFFNSDGSEAEMCGNAARCVAKYVFDRGLEKENLLFKSIAGMIGAQIFPGGFVEVEMTSPKTLNAALEVVIGEVSVTGFYIDTGVPHLVISEDSQIKDIGAIEMARELMYADAFQPQKTNVTIVSRSEEKFCASTFERGVEDFTEACGTGAVAAAAFFVRRGEKEMSESISIKMPGGELRVRFEEEMNKSFLYGPTEYVGSLIVELGG